MALVTCPDCGTQVSDSAPNCLKCGRPLGAAVGTASHAPVARKKPFYTRKRFIIPAALLALIIVASMSSGGGDNASSAAGVAEAPAAPEVTVTAAKLFEDYQANEVSADSKYKGKSIAVTGTLNAIRKDFMDNTILDFRTSNEFMPVHARLEESQVSRAGTLAKGNKVTVTCKGGGMIMGSPQLSECVIS
jgi:hypothetical protein